MDSVIIASLQHICNGAPPSVHSARASTPLSNNHTEKSVHQKCHIFQLTHIKGIRATQAARVTLGSITTPVLYNFSKGFLRASLKTIFIR